MSTSRRASVRSLRWPAFAALALLFLGVMSGVALAAPVASALSPTVAAPAVVWNPVVGVTFTSSSVLTKPTAMYIDGVLTTAVTWTWLDGSVHKQGRITTQPSQLADSVSHIARASCYDASGVPTTSQWTFAVAAPPQFANLVPADGAQVTTLRPTISSVLSDNSTASLTGTIAVDGTELATSYNATTKVLSATAASGLSNDASHTVVARARDANGNERVVTWSFYVHANAPTIGSVAPANGTTLTVASGSMTVAASDPLGIVSPVAWVVDGANSTSPWIPGVGGPTAGTASLPFTNLADGTHTAAVTLTDAGQATATRQWSFGVACPPALGAPVPADSAQLDTRTPVVSIPVSDNSSVATVTATIDTRAAVVTLSAGTAHIALPGPLGNDATHTVVVIAKDAAGNTSTRTWSFHVQIFASPPSTGECTRCHTGFPAPNHPTKRCVLCHDAGPVGNCSYCHDCPLEGGAMDGLVYGSIPWSHSAVDMEGFPCKYCHESAYYPDIPSHPADIDEAHATTHDMTKCADCHDRTLTREHYARKDALGNPLTCPACHESSDPRVVAAIRDGVSDCFACHASSGGSGGFEHADLHTSSLDAACTSCHAANLVTEHLHSTTHANVTCATCHDSADADVVSAIQTGDTACTACHAEITDAHKAVHVTAVGSNTSSGLAGHTCGECHAGNLIDEHAKVTSSSAAGGCAACHPSPRDTITGSWNKGCVQSGCHASGEGGGLHEHFGQKHTLPTTTSQTCVTAGCHSAGDLTTIHTDATATIGGRAVAGCMVCHHDGTVPPTKDCITCHGSDPHPGGLDALHTGTQTSGSISILGTVFGTHACSECHSGTDVRALHPNCATCHPDLDDQVRPWDKSCATADCHASNSSQPMHGSIDASHTIATNSCMASGCHASTTNAALVHTKQGCTACHDTGKTLSTTCADCHVLATPHGDLAAKHPVNSSASCTGSHCHGSTLDPVAIHAGRAEGACAVCHANPTRGDLAAGKTSADCAGCHTAEGIGYHTAMSVHVWSGMDSSCQGAGCHTNDLRTAHAAFVGTGNRYPQYPDTCSLCHRNTDSGRIDWDTATSACTSCHTGHGDLTPIHAGTDTSATISILGTRYGNHACSECHSSTDVRTIHGGSTSCATCHPTPANGMSSWNGSCAVAGCHGSDATKPQHGTIDASHTVGPQSCTNDGCHPGAGDLAAIHSNATTTTAGVTLRSCQICHAAGRTPSATCSNCHAMTGHGDVSSVHAARITADWITFFYGDASHMTEEGHGGTGIDAYATCSMCHSQMNLLALHGNDCALCHLGTNPPRKDFTTWDGSCSDPGCHSSYHDGASDGHDGEYWWERDVNNYNCGSCHDFVDYNDDNPVYASTDFCGRCHSLGADTTAPTSSSDALASYIGTASVTITGHDDRNLKEIQYRLDGGATQTVNGLSGTDPSTSLVVAPPTTGTRSHTLEFWSKDWAGHVQAVHNTALFTVTPDVTAPVTSSDTTASFTGPVTIHLTPTDDGTSPGVAATYWQIDNGQVHTGTTATMPQPTSGTESHTIYFWSVDFAGNTESRKHADFTDTADLVAPTTTASMLSVYNPSTWGGGTYVTFYPAPNDPAPSSGIAQVYVKPNDGNYWTFWGDQEATRGATWHKAWLEGANWRMTAGYNDGVHSVSYFSVDKAGNAGPSGTTTFTTDFSGPSGSVTINNGDSSTSNSAVALTLSATDVGTSVSQMQFSNDGSSWSGWETYAPTKSWTLASGTGVRYVYVRYKDASGNVGYGSSDSIIVTATAPNVTNVTSTLANGSYTTGQVVPVTVTFSSLVYVTGSPRIQMNVGGATRYATYSSGGGSYTLTFNYTAVAGDTNADLDYASTSALTLNGGTIRDNSSVSANLTLPTPGASGSLGSNKNIAIDTTTPTTTNVTSTLSNGTYGIGQVVPITITFSELVNVTGTPQLTLSTGSPATTVINYASGSGSNTLTFNYTVAAGNSTADLAYASTGALALNGGTIRDAAGNAAALALASPGASGSLNYNKDIVISTSGPIVTNVTSTLANGTYKAGQVVPITVTFSAVVNVTGTPQLTLSTGSPATTAVNYSSGSGSNTLTFNYTVAAGNSSADLAYASTGALALNGGTIRDGSGTAATLTLPAPGASGSLNSNKDIVVDTTAPTVTNVTSTLANGTYGAGQVVPITVTFGEVVNVTGTPQLTLSTGSPATTAVNYSSGSGSNTLTFNYTVAAGNSSADLAYASAGALALNGCTINDAAGNAATLALAPPGASGSLDHNKDIVISAGGTHGTRTFTFTGADQTFTVPSGVSTLSVTMYGGAGGTDRDYPHDGGNGGEVVAAIGVTPGSVLTLKVGGQGEDWDSDKSGAMSGGWPNGGDSADNGYACGGGGSSTIWLGPTILAEAGGGGGGGDSHPGDEGGAQGTLPGGFERGDDAEYGSNCAGGGGGWNGGVAETYDGNPADGGTSYIAVGTGTLTPGAGEGDGRIVLSWTADTVPPVTTSDAVSTYSLSATIHLSATDTGGSGVAGTAYILDSGAQTTGTVVTTSVLGSHTLRFWSVDTAGNREATNTVTFSVAGGSGTIRLVWGDCDTTAYNPVGGSYADWTIRSGGPGGPIVAQDGEVGGGGWNGIDDITVPAQSSPYWVTIDWYDADYDSSGSPVFFPLYVTSNGQVVAQHY